MATRRLFRSAACAKGWIARWNAIPLYARILIAMAFGIVTGLVAGEEAIVFEIPSKVILQLLGALAPPLILVAVTHVLMTTQIAGRTAGRLAGLLLLNTTVAILIGLCVANVLRPGTWSEFKRPVAAVEKELTAKSPAELLVQNVPKSILGPLGDRQNIIGVIIIAVAFGVALRGVKTKPIKTVQDFVEVGYEVLLTVLHWVIQLVPIGVFAIVAKVVGTEGFAPFKAMGAFILSVLVALLLQATWYLLRIRFFSWVKPLDAIRGMRDALELAVRQKGRPFLGICVGMQLMASRGLEHGVHEGLGWIGGEVDAIHPSDPALKIPHMGWNTLDVRRPHPLLEGISTGPDGLHAYFVHSYHLTPADPADLVAVTDYGGPVTAMVARDNLAGTQFHPEKSQRLGLALIANFLSWRP